jgi:hypothetical protein
MTKQRCLIFGFFGIGDANDFKDMIDSEQTITYEDFASNATFAGIMSLDLEAGDIGGFIDSLYTSDLVDDCTPDVFVIVPLEDPEIYYLLLEKENYNKEENK